MLQMQDGKPIANAKRKQTLFILDLDISGKIPKVNGITNTTSITA